MNSGCATCKKVLTRRSNAMDDRGALIVNVGVRVNVRLLHSKSTRELERRRKMQPDYMVA